jgi:hypothetical protein
MKRLIKAMLKAPWRWSQPLRRPFVRKLEAFLARSFRPSDRILVEETNALMDQVVRELVRLQRQVEYLQQAVEDLSPAREVPAIAGEIDAAEHLKAG